MRPVSVGVNLTPTVKTTVFTVPTRQVAKFNLLFASNHTASAKNFTAYWYDKSNNTEVAIVEDYPLPSKEFLKFDGGAYVTLEEGDEIRLLVEAGADCSAICTFELEATSAVQYSQY